MTLPPTRFAALGLGAALLLAVSGAAPRDAHAKKPDRDGDGIPDDVDKCPDDPEDKDGFEDTDGCSEADNDGDGIDDLDDACPNVAETLNGVEDKDGCPDVEKAKLLYSKGKILIREPVFFTSGKHAILPKSYDLLNQMAAFLKVYTKFKKIMIEGHTDNKGDSAKNLELSEKRAKAVMDYLVKEGVGADRLVYKGYGDAKPVADNATEAGRSKNRRVEFVVLEE
ncbi:MAG TPA: OmpA family protein [Myxococcota bacterium]|jgi:outer membrane protein OmpA-like peptidoglycan-associated protein|nr:OmpA family protein [Myxococcota bacterium]